MAASAPKRYTTIAMGLFWLLKFNDTSVVVAFVLFLLFPSYPLISYIPLLITLSKVSHLPPLNGLVCRGVVRALRITRCFLLLGLAGTALYFAFCWACLDSIQASFQFSPIFPSWLSILTEVLVLKYVTHKYKVRYLLKKEMNLVALSSDSFGTLHFSPLAT